MASYLTLIPLSISLSADAFAASLARGGKQRTPQILPAIRSGAVFDAFLAGGYGPIARLVARRLWADGRFLAGSPFGDQALIAFSLAAPYLRG